MNTRIIYHAPWPWLCCYAYCNNVGTLSVSPCFPMLPSYFCFILLHYGVCRDESLAQKCGGTISPPPYKWTCSMCQYKRLLLVNESTKVFCFLCFFRATIYILFHPVPVNVPHWAFHAASFTQSFFLAPCERVCFLCVCQSKKSATQPIRGRIGWALEGKANCKAARRAKRRRYYSPVCHFASHSSQIWSHMPKLVPLLFWFPLEGDEWTFPYRRKSWLPYFSPFRLKWLT